MSLLAAAEVACGASRRASVTPQARRSVRSIAELERRVGGRIGVFALNTATGATIKYREDERFAMASTFKWVLAAAVLARVDNKSLSSDESLTFSEADLLDHAPFTRSLVTKGSAKVVDLAQAVVTVSDNTAANLLLKRMGGTEAFTAFVRSFGDEVTRLDRWEPWLNTNEPNDDRDTTSPLAMVGLMDRILCGKALSPQSRERLLQWLRTSHTGKMRLRLGLPQDAVVGDKTGTGARGAVNDVAIVTRADGHSLLIAAYLSESPAPLARLEEAHAEIGRIVSRFPGRASGTPRKAS